MNSSKQHSDYIRVHQVQGTVQIQVQSTHVHVQVHVHVGAPTTLVDLIDLHVQRSCNCGKSIF